mgnify:FL=1
MKRLQEISGSLFVKPLKVDGKCFDKEKTGCKLKRQMIIYNEIYRKN